MWLTWALARSVSERTREETLLTWTDERALSARTAPGITPVDSSKTRTPVRELMWPSVLGESSVGCLQEPIDGVENLEYAIQATASVWTPFEQACDAVSGDVDFDSFGMAPWDAGGMHGDRCQPHDAIHIVKSQWSMRFLCRPAIAHGLDRKTAMNTENELDMIILIDTDSPRLTVIPGEYYASHESTQIRCDLRHTHDTSAVTDGYTVEPNDMIFRRMSFHSENVSAGRDEIDGSPRIDCAVLELIDLTFRRLRLPQRDVSAERDENHVSLEIDSVAVELIDLCFRRLRLPPEDFAAAWDIAAADIDDRIFRLTSFPPNEFPGGREDDYIWLTSGSNQSVCARPVTGSLCFGHPHGLLSLHCLESVTLTPNCHCQTTAVRIASDICYSHHTWYIEGYAIRSSITVILTVWYSDYEPWRLTIGLIENNRVLRTLRRVPCQGRFWDPGWIYGQRVCMR